MAKKKEKKKRRPQRQYVPKKPATQQLGLRGAEKKMFKPTKNVMTRIGKRVARPRQFPLEMEQQGEEWLARFNWEAGKTAGVGEMYQGTVNFAKIGKERTPMLNISGTIISIFKVPFDEQFVETGKACFKTKIKKKFGAKVKMMRVSTSPKRDRINFRGYFVIGEKIRLTANDLDVISDFMHNSFRCFQPKGDVIHIPIPK